ncbi:FAD/NAD(P)-binding domain-containing protein [Apiospora arundinis]|uniref:FAD/NAD(P)-binding domain-containing protein n=1 Tax=Apiospora arundinis TaxID=335852 RepID=A0ABR2J8V4_9PEZI
MTKTVCIVGAGPSGLVAAKTLLHDVAPAAFKVTVYDAQPRIGGLWPLSKDDAAGLVHPLMVANQSKHTVQFSDLAWDDNVPQMPKAWQVGQYLKRYSEKYGGADIKLGHKVVRTELLSDGAWKVETESDEGSQSHTFDHLLVTTGFFGRPIWPEYLPKESEIPIVHSSKYRDLKGLLAGGNSKGHKILVVGGQMSGIEIAGTIASHLSSAVHCPGEKPIENPEKYSIRHVAQRPSWVFPLFTSAKPAAAAPPFLPCDLPSYNLVNRPHPLTNNSGHISVESAKVFNSIFQSVLGGDQGDFSPDIKISDDLIEQQPFLAMSNHYADFVRSGMITVSQGKVSAMSGNTAVLSPTDEKIEDIAAVVLATGFDPCPSLAFLPPDVLEKLSYAPSHPSLPAALAFHGTHHPSLSTLGFVGFYRSPYWGVMEMQARFIARLWTAPNPSGALKEALDSDSSIQNVLDLRVDPRLSQFPMGDYAFLMQEFSKALDMKISPPRETPPLANGKSMDILTPARYVSEEASDSQLAEAEKNLASTHETALGGLAKAKFVAHAVFRSLLGEWKLERDLASKLPSHPSGRFVGTAKFLLRQGTTDGRSIPDEGDLGMEYLYIEDGNFTASNGMSFRATRRYVWRYDEARDVLSVWFAKTDDNMRADYLFHDIEFIVPSAEDEVAQNRGWQAKASHLCIEDLYNVQYEFKFQAVNLKEWRIGYSVNGPKKDYTISGVYRR